MQLLDVPLDLLDAAPRNANKMSPAKFSELVNSIRRIGFITAIVARDTGNGRFEIVDGHHRAKAMREIGELVIPSVMFSANEDPRLVALALNRLRGETDLATASQIIDDLLSIEQIDLSSLSISGFSERELNDLVAALNQDELDLDDLGSADLPQEVGSDVVKPFLLELTFRTKEDLAAARKSLRKAAGKGSDLSDGLLRLIRAE
jgi:ParB-like chromosome segregation protein Spo0J